MGDAGDAFGGAAELVVVVRNVSSESLPYVNDQADKFEY